MSVGAIASPRAFVVWFRDLHRWSVGSFVSTGWHWPADVIRPLSTALSRKNIEVDRSKTPKEAIRLVTLHFDGEIELRDANAGDSFKGRLSFADPGDVIYSKIDVRNGAIGIIPDDLGRVCVSSEHPVYAVDPNTAEAHYIKLLFRTEVFRRKINSMISGASGRKRVQPKDLETVEVPLPSLSVQRKIVAVWQLSRAEVDHAFEGLKEPIQSLNATLYDLANTNALIRRFLLARWCALESWDMHSARAACFRLDNPKFVRLGDFAEEATELVRPWEKPDQEWPVYGVNNQEGVFLSHFQRGDAFNSPYKRIRKDWFFHNPTRANVGSLGIVPDVPDDAITSPEYQVWRIKHSLLPGYVATLIATPFFIDLIQVHRVGAVKQRLYVENLLRIPIPIVSETKQREIAAMRDKALGRIAAAKSRSEIAREEVEAMILGTKPVEGA
ncbi:MAG: hypothetical protein HY645_15620 [Acidobacteria bacterium]|nr:hypothetical protein [Acidobacteriota bacterium]